ncbi:MAG: hypothetical protein Q4Q58_00590 [Thermoplasmata archaeon]|nr:hypothetical protein [Thermoplasmata archaeon]
MAAHVSERADRQETSAWVQMGILVLAATACASFLVYQGQHMSGLCVGFAGCVLIVLSGFVSLNSAYQIDNGSRDYSRLGLLCTIVSIVAVIGITYWLWTSVQ